MKKTILLVVVIAILVYAGGYALSQSSGGQDGGSRYPWGMGGYGMMGPGMMGMMGYTGGAQVNPETQQPLTPEELNQYELQMHSDCLGLMGYNPPPTSQ